MGSQHISKPGEPIHGLREAMPEQDVEVAIDIEWRGLQLLSLPLRSGDHCCSIEIEDVLDKQFRVLSFELERLEYIGREVALVGRHDHAGVGAYRGGEDVPVVRVGKSQALDQDFVPGHHSVRDCPVHQVRGAIELLGREIRPVLQQVALPLVVNLGTSSARGGVRTGRAT